MSWLQLRRTGFAISEMPARRGPGPLDGKIFVFTGGLERFTRDEAQRMVEELGGRVTSSVSAKTDFVVAGRDPGSKLEEAKAHGVRTIDEKEFERLVRLRGS